MHSLEVKCLTDFSFKWWSNPFQKLQQGLSDNIPQEWLDNDSVISRQWPVYGNVTTQFVGAHYVYKQTNAVHQMYSSCTPNTCPSSFICPQLTVNICNTTPCIILWARSGTVCHTNTSLDGLKRTATSFPRNIMLVCHGANMELDACRCATKGRAIFSSECTRNHLLAGLTRTTGELSSTPQIC